MSKSERDIRATTKLLASLKPPDVKTKKQLMDEIAGLWRADERWRAAHEQLQADHDDLVAKLAAMTLARDLACDIAVQVWDGSPHRIYEMLAPARAVGDDK